MASVPAEQWPRQRRRKNSIHEPPVMSSESVRLVVFGDSDHHQFSLTDSILQKSIFTDSDPRTTLTTKTTKHINKRNVTLINTPNLTDHDLLHCHLKSELKKAVCFSSPGPHAVLFTLNAFNIPPNTYDVFRPVVQYFGEAVLKHVIIVLFHEEEHNIEDSVRKNKDFRELLEKCGQRYIIFSERENRQNNNMTKKLFEMMDQMITEHGMFSNQEFKDAEKRIQKELRNLEKEHEKEVRRRKEALEKQHSGEDLEKEVKLYEESVRMENRDRAELLTANKIGFTLRIVDYAAAIGKGAAVGALLGYTVGIPVDVGAVIGAALGGLVGGVAGAAWTFITGAISDALRG